MCRHSYSQHKTTQTTHSLHWTFKKIYLFLVGGSLLYSVVLASYSNINQSQVYICLPLLWPPRPLPRRPISLGCHRAPGCLPCVIQQIPTFFLFSVWQCIFPCSSLYSSHPLISPLWQVGSLCLHLSCYLATRFIHVIFLDSIYMHQDMIFRFLFQTCFTLYNRLYVHPPHSIDLNLFLLMLSNISLYTCTSTSLSIHLVCFHVLTIVNIAAMNIGIHVSLSVMVSSEYMPSSGIAGSFGSFIP
jgi:hypothetical protein